MYKIIGADGKEYGPIPADVLKQWIAEGRANQHTRVLPEGSTEWKALSEIPELAAALPPSAGVMSAGAGAPPPPPPPSLGGAPVYNAGGPDAMSQVNGPGIGLMVVGILSLVLGIPSLLMHLMGANMFPPNLPPEAAWMKVMMGPIGIASNLVNIVIGVLILIGGLKMRKLESYGLVMTAAILSIIPCTTSCCLVGIPIGVWAVVVLMRPEVKSAFH
jgi:hypothetical protein